MSKRKKVKNPCKLCLGTVTKKTGLQCKGACESWVHYACLNYTPAKIKDIKAGIIKVSCPCPDCKSTLPKEFRTDEPFSCSNLQCPAKQPPKCNTKCSANKGSDKMNQTSTASTKEPCPLSKCGENCRNFPSTPAAPVIPKTETSVPQNSKPLVRNKLLDCSSGCLAPGDGPDHGHCPMGALPSLGALEQMCITVGQLTHQISSLMSKMRQIVQDRAGGCNRHSCSQKGHRSMCPKPCYCPGNPGKG